jgi:hypothetical protein
LAFSIFNTNIVKTFQVVSSRSAAVRDLQEEYRGPGGFELPAGVMCFDFFPLARQQCGIYKRNIADPAGSSCQLA